MANINSVALSGNLVADPEVKYVGAAGDFAIGNLRLAVNRDKKQEDGSYASEASLFNLTVLGKFAELVDRKCRKGDAISVKGRLEQQTWQDKDTGSNREKVVVIVEDLDGAAMYRKADDVPAKQDGSTSSAPASSGTSTAADDDIPF